MCLGPFPCPHIIKVLRTLGNYPIIHSMGIPLSMRIRIPSFFSRSPRMTTLRSAEWEYICYLSVLFGNIRFRKCHFSIVEISLFMVVILLFPNFWLCWNQWSSVPTKLPGAVGKAQGSPETICPTVPSFPLCCCWCCTKGSTVKKSSAIRRIIFIVSSAKFLWRRHPVVSQQPLESH